MSAIGKISTGARTTGLGRTETTTIGRHRPIVRSNLRESSLLGVGQVPLDFVCGNRTRYAPSVGEEDGGSPAYAKALAEAQHLRNRSSTSTCCPREPSVKH